jgi:predicted HAD superfamily Cof-like phosphohydrolase
VPPIAQTSPATAASTSLKPSHQPDRLDGHQLVLPWEAHDLPTPLLHRRHHQPPSRVAAMVAAFHRAFGLHRRRSPSLEDVDRPLLELRTRLLDEETAEFAAAAAQRDLIGMADALADVVYVAYGTAITVGVDLDAVLDEVHRSNMSKLDGEGRPVLRDDGKVLKSPRYFRPDVAGVIASQPPLPFH